MSIRVTFLGLLLAVIALGRSFDAGAVVIDFDTVPDATVIDNAYSALGVTFNNPLGGSIYARDTSISASPPNVVSVFSSEGTAFDARDGAVEAVFSSPQSFVSIDAAILRASEGGTPTNFPKLEVYDTNGAFITAVEWNFTVGPQPPGGGSTGYQTLAYSSAALNIGKVRFLSDLPAGNPSNFGSFDNLTFEAGPASGPAASIGVQFTGGGGMALTPTLIAGVKAQYNYNVASGMSGSDLALMDNSGGVTTARLTFSTNESGYKTTLFTNPVTPNEILNHGILNGTGGTNPTITITGIPYPVYDLIVYTLDNEPRSQRVTATTAARSTSFTVRSPNGDAPGYQDSDAATSYTYIQGTTNSLTPVANSDYVRFINLTGNVTLTADARNATFSSNTNDNAFINGFQIVEARGARLYGLSGPGSGQGHLYTIDTTTGVATPVAELSGPPTIFPVLGGLDFLRGTLYATGVYAGSSTYDFGTIDTSTGVFTPITAQDQANWHGLAGNESADVLYTVGTDTLPFVLKSITSAGETTDIGQTGFVGGEGLAYDNVHGILYANYGDRIYTLNTSTGAPTLVGSMGFSPGTAGLAYDPSLDVLYLNDYDTNTLYRVSPSTGQATLIGSNRTNRAAINALPEPSAVFMLCPGALLIGLLAAPNDKRHEVSSRRS